MNFDSYTGKSIIIVAFFSSLSSYCCLTSVIHPTACGFLFICTFNKMADDANKSEKATDRAVRKLSCDLGPGWDNPTSHRRQKPAQPSSSSPAVPSLLRQSSSVSEPFSRLTDTPATQGSDAVAMSSRGNQRRGPNRNTDISQHGEELAIWKDVKDQLPNLVDMVNQSSANVAAMYEQDKLCAEKKRNKGMCTVACCLVVFRCANNDN